MFFQKKAKKNLFIQNINSQYSKAFGTFITNNTHHHHFSSNNQHHLFTWFKFKMIQITILSIPPSSLHFIVTDVLYFSLSSLTGSNCVGVILLGYLRWFSTWVGKISAWIGLRAVLGWVWWFSWVRLGCFGGWDCFRGGGVVWWVSRIVFEVVWVVLMVIWMIFRNG